MAWYDWALLLGAYCMIGGGAYLLGHARGWKSGAENTHTSNARWIQALADQILAGADSTTYVRHAAQIYSMSLQVRDDALREQASATSKLMLAIGGLARAARQGETPSADRTH